MVDVDHLWSYCFCWRLGSFCRWTWHSHRASVTSGGLWVGCMCKLARPYLLSELTFFVRLPYQAIHRTFFFQIFLFNTHHSTQTPSYSSSKLWCCLAGSRISMSVAIYGRYLPRVRIRTHSSCLGSRNSMNWSIKSFWPAFLRSIKTTAVSVIQWNTLPWTLICILFLSFLMREPSEHMFIN